MTQGFGRKFLFLSMIILTWLTLQPVLCAAQSYNIKTYRYQDGVISNVVFNGVQDHFGKMWFATRNGVAIYDSIIWRDARQEFANSPEGEGLVALGEDGSIWWASLQAPFRVCHLVDERWQDIPGCAVRESQWQLSGFRVFKDAQGHQIVALSSLNGHVLIRKDSQWTTIEKGRANLTVYSLEVKQSSLFLSTDVGLMTIDLQSLDQLFPVCPELPAGPVFAVAPSSPGDFTWVVGRDWVARLKNGKLDSVFSTPGLILNAPFTMSSACLSTEGGFYYVDSAHAFIFHPNYGIENLILSSGVATDDGFCVMSDRESNIWITSQRGISQIISRNLAYFNLRHGLFKDEVSAVFQRVSGEMVLGHLGGLTFQGSQPRTLSFDSGPGILSRVMDLAEDEKGTLWIAARHQGVGQLLENDEIRWFGTDNSFLGPVYSVLSRGEQEIFIGTRNGVFQKKGTRFEKISLPGLGDDDTPFVRRLIPLASGGFCAATKTHGLFCWENGVITHFPAGDLTGLANVYTAFEFSDGRLWAGTKHGLCVVEDGKLELSSVPNPEIRRPIYGILQDNNGHMWFGTDEGVVIWDGKTQRRITTREGLLGSETNRAALKLDTNGHVWIGTESGASVYRSEFDFPGTVAPILSLTEIIINGENYPIDEPLTVQGPLGTLTFEFQAPYFISDKHMKFRAKTIGSMADELPLVISWPGMMNLTNVGAGQFQIMIEGKTPDGLITNRIVTPLITINPPLADRWYTRLSMGLASALMLYFVFAFITGRRYSFKLEAEVERQTRELRQNEEASRLESERLAGTLESISDGVVVVDGQGRVVLFNNAAESMFLKSSNAHLGCTLTELLPVEIMADPGQASRYADLLKDPAGIRLFNEQVSIKGRENKINWFEISAVPITRAPGGLVFAFRNITSRLYEEERDHRAQKLDSLGLLAGGIAHDFNNLLTIMLGNLSLVTSTLVMTAHEAAQLDKIRHASERARSLTHQLLTFAKGGVPVIRPANVSSIIRESAELNLSGSQIDFSLDLATDLLWAEVDADQISQVVGNLLINALQAMPNGGQLKVIARNALNWPGFDPETRVLVVVVEDSGSGISEQDQARIFDPYFTTKSSGSGLGLAIVHSIAQKHGGTLSVDSTLGQGSSFSFVLPACDPETPNQLEGTFSPGKSSYTKPRVLFMDDELDIRSIMAGMLAHLRYDYQVVADGEAALAAFTRARSQGQPFGVVLLDLTIPGGMGGRDTAQKLKKLAPEIPLIVASGYNEDPVMAGYQKYGFSGVLMKPFDLGGLQKILNEVAS